MQAQSGNAPALLGPEARLEHPRTAMTSVDHMRLVIGLSDTEASARLALEGPNVMPRPRPRSIASRIGRQLSDPLVLLLVAAFAVTLAIGDITDSLIIALVVAANTAIGVVQEARADKAIAALDSMAAPNARVVREGNDRVVPAADLVVGDVVRVEAGDVVPADLRLIQAHQLRLDEAALTGESVPVAKEPEAEVFAGTVVVAGRATGVVIRTGAASALGRIAAAIARTRPGPTPLQRRLAALGRVLGLIVVVLSALVFGIGVISGTPTVQMAITAVSLVVAAVPESLPAVVTLALALAARRMAARNAIPRRLHAVETLGSVTVVASDKTGTLTEGRMAVRRAVDADGREFRVNGHGYEPTGSVIGATDSSAPASLQALAHAAMLCSDAVLRPPSADHREWRAIGDPMEAALVAFAGRCGIAFDEERAAWSRAAERPFDPQTRRMTTVHRHRDGRVLTICKGAPEVVLRPPIVPDLPEGAEAAAADLAAAGLRVLAVAVREERESASPAVASPENAADTPAGGGPRSDEELDPPIGLRYLGLVGIGDPVREDAPAVAEDFAAAGIRLLLITGDHPGTATSIGGDVGIWRPGDEVHHGGDGAPDAERANQVRVFARVPPEQKLDIIAALQANGHVVAMTGDGVNDAPALRRADIGVAMGSGTEVARQAADLVLVDDNLGTMAAAVREGRRIYDNIRRFLHYGLSGGTAELVVMLLGPFMGLPLTLLPAQILWINLLTHGIPGVALGAEPAEPDTARRPPRPPQESVLGAGLAAATVRTGLVLATVVLGVGIIAAQTGRPWQSMIFLVLGLGQLGVALAVRARRQPGGERNPWLFAAVFASAVLMLAGIFVGPLRELLGTAPLAATDTLWCVAAALVPFLLLSAARFLDRPWRRSVSRR